MFLQRPAAPQYTPETIAAIQAAVAGKEQILWDTEQAIIAAINADTGLTLLQKASEIARSMNRFISSAQGMNTAANPFPIFGDMAYAQMQQFPYGMENVAMCGSNGMGGMMHGVNPIRTHNYSFTTPATETEVSKEYTLIFPGDVFNKYKGIDVFSGGERLLGLTLATVVDSRDEMNGIGIGIIASEPNTWLNEFASEIFNAIMGALDQAGETDKYSYTIRKTLTSGMDPNATSDVLYIDLANNDDPLEVENFSDLLKGNIAEAVPYELLFREVNG